MTDSKVCTHPYSVRPLLILSAQPALHRSFHRRVLTTSATPGSIVSNVQVIGLYSIPPELPIVVRLPAVARGDTAHGGDTSHLLCRTPLMSTRLHHDNYFVSEARDSTQAHHHCDILDGLYLKHKSGAQKPSEDELIQRSPVSGEPSYPLRFTHL